MSHIFKKSMWICYINKIGWQINELYMHRSSVQDQMLNVMCLCIGSLHCLINLHFICFCSFVIAGIVPGAGCASTQCVNHASCNTTSKCQCDAGYTATPTAKPTMCKFKSNWKYWSMPPLHLSLYPFISMICIISFTSR